jgi:uncharacterized membrane protein
VTHRTFGERTIVVAGILGAIVILLGATRLGFVAVPTPLGDATIMHLPVIIGGILEGPVVGVILGALFGIFSFLQVGSPIFKDPLVSILPRLFIGITAYLAYATFRRVSEYAALIVAAVVGTLTNTILVLGVAVLRGYLTSEAAVGYGIAAAVPEAILAVIVVVAVITAWKRIETGRGKSRV